VRGSLIVLLISVHHSMKADLLTIIESEGRHIGIVVFSLNVGIGQN